MVLQLSAVKDATLSVKLLSLARLGGETLDKAKAKKSLFQQLISDIGKLSVLLIA